MDDAKSLVDPIVYQVKSYAIYMIHANSHQVWCWFFNFNFSIRHTYMTWHTCMTCTDVQVSHIYVTCHAQIQIPLPHHHVHITCGPHEEQRTLSFKPRNYAMRNCWWSGSWLTVEPPDVSDHDRSRNIYISVGRTSSSSSPAPSRFPFPVLT